MTVIDELKNIVDANNFPNPDKVKRELDVLATLPGKYNEAVFDKLLELAMHDHEAITIFIEQFIKTSLNLLENK